MLLSSINVSSDCNVVFWLLSFAKSRKLVTFVPMFVFALSANPGGCNGQTKIRKFSQKRTNFLIFFDTKKKGSYQSTASPEKQKRV